MAGQWSQVAYGKLASEPGGSIVPGADYRNTGRSENLTSREGELCAPENLGITDREDWKTYPWRADNGPILLRTVHHGGDWLAIVSRLRPRAERPGSSRWYVESRNLLIPVDQVGHADLFAFPGLVSAEPLAKVDLKLPRVWVDSPTTPSLAPGWFAEVRPLLSSVVSGARSVTVNVQMAPDQYFVLALLALACLPAAIRWRIPVAAGLLTVPAADKDRLRFGLAHGASARGVAADPGVAAEIVGDGDSPGVAYVDWLDGKIRGASTVSELLNVVDALFPAFVVWDAIDPEVPWTAAMRPLHEVGVLRRLSSWLARPSHEPVRLDSLSMLRGSALKLIIDSALVRYPASPPIASRLLASVAGPAWREEWRRIASDAQSPEAAKVRAASMLLGLETPVDPKAVASAPGFDLPDDLHAAVGDRLAHALRGADTQALTSWSELLAQAVHQNAPNWVRAWGRAFEGLILWRAARLNLPDHPVFSGSKGSGIAASALGELLGNNPPSAASFQLLLPTVTPETVTDAESVTKSLRHTNLVVEAMFLASRCESLTGKPVGLANTLSREEIARLDAGRRQALAAVLAVGSRKYGSNDGIDLALVLLGEHLPQDADLRDRLARRLGYPFASILLKARAGAYPNDTAWVDAVAGDAFLLSQEAVQAATEYLEDPTARGLLLGPLSRAINLTGPAFGSGSKALKFLSDLRFTTCKEYPELTTQDALLVCELTRSVDPPVDFRPPPVPKSLGQFRALLAAAPWLAEAPRPADDSNVLTAALDSYLSDPATRQLCAAALRDTAWGQAPPWRLFLGPVGLQELTGLEEILFNRLPEPNGLRAILLGYPVSPTALCRRVRLDSLLSQKVTPSQAGSLLELAADLDLPHVALEVLRYALINMKKHTRADLWTAFSGFSRPRPVETSDPWGGVGFQAALATAKQDRKRILQWLRSEVGPIPPSFRWSRLTVAHADDTEHPALSASRPGEPRPAGGERPFV